MGREITYAIVGVAGFVASRHLEAIKATGGRCVAAMDPHDSVGILDSYFPECRFFVEFGRFERYLEKQKNEGKLIDYLVVCSPNYLHDFHVRFGLKYGCDIICEKPLSINPHNVKAIIKAEQEYGRSVNNILQLRLHPSLLKIKNLIDSTSEKINVKLHYQAPRGNWYYTSWKGNEEKSGGILMNIGVHFFDLMIQLFGKPILSELNEYSKSKANGIIVFRNVNMVWQLDISQRAKMKGFRGIEIEGQIFDFTDRMQELHVLSYRKILSGEGYKSESVLPSIELVSNLRSQNQNTNVPL